VDHTISLGPHVAWKNATFGPGVGHSYSLHSTHTAFFFGQWQSFQNLFSRIMYRVARSAFSRGQLWSRKKQILW